MAGSDDEWEALFAKAKGVVVTKTEQIIPPKEPYKKAEPWQDVAKDWSTGFDNQPDMKSVRDGELVRTLDVLDRSIASALYRGLQDSNSWSVAKSNRDNPTQHVYRVGFGTGELEAFLESVVKVFQTLVPDLPCRFQASKYSEGDYIEPHDDIGYLEIDGKPHRRKFAAVLYLTEKWSEDRGGIFVDHVDGKELCPVFNSMVLFQVPRLHQVTPVVGARKRYSIFGWFYEPYDEPKTKSNKRKKKKTEGIDKKAKQK